MAENIPRTFKIKFDENGETKRFAATESFAVIVSNMTANWGKRDFALTYIDEDNDSIKVTNDADLKEARLMAQDMGLKVLKFTASDQSDQSQPCSAQVLTKSKPTQKHQICASELKQQKLKMKRLAKSQEPQKPRISATELIQRKMTMKAEQQTKLKQTPFQICASELRNQKLNMKCVYNAFPPVYLSMLDAGVPKDAVINRLCHDGIVDWTHRVMTERSLREHLRTSSPACDQQDGHQRPILSQVWMIPEVRKYPRDSAQQCSIPKIYINMLRAGVPWEAVVHRMKTERQETGQQLDIQKQPQTQKQKQKQTTATDNVSSLRAKLCNGLKQGVKLNKTSQQSSQQMAVRVEDNYASQDNNKSPAERQPQAQFLQSSPECVSEPVSPTSPRNLHSWAFLMDSSADEEDQRTSSCPKHVSFHDNIAAIPRAASFGSESDSDSEPESSLAASDATLVAINSNQDAVDAVATVAESNARHEQAKVVVEPFQAEQRQLQSMGFVDRSRNVALLTCYQGRLDLVINSLFDSF